MLSDQLRPRDIAGELLIRFERLRFVFIILWKKYHVIFNHWPSPEQASEHEVSMLRRRLDRSGTRTQVPHLGKILTVRWASCRGAYIRRASLNAIHGVRICRTSKDCAWAVKAMEQIPLIHQDSKRSCRRECWHSLVPSWRLAKAADQRRCPCGLRDGSVRADRVLHCATEHLFHIERLYFIGWGWNRSTFAPWAVIRRSEILCKMTGDCQ